MESTITPIIIGIAVFIGIVFLLFLLIRELNLWYFRINERVKLQERTNFLLSQIFIKLGGDYHEIQMKESDQFVGYRQISKEILDTLTEQEKAKLYQASIDGIKRHTLIVMKKSTRDLIVLHDTDWQKIYLENEEGDYIKILERG